MTRRLSFRYAGEQSKAQLEAAVVQHRQQQGLLDACALSPDTTAPSKQRQSGSGNGSGRATCSSQSAYNPIRIVGMSATLPNIQQVRWFHHAAVGCMSVKPLAAESSSIADVSPVLCMHHQQVKQSCRQRFVMLAA